MYDDNLNTAMGDAIVSAVATGLLGVLVLLAVWAFGG